jgi:hypothetical protein
MLSSSKLLCFKKTIFKIFSDDFEILEYLGVRGVTKNSLRGVSNFLYEKIQSKNLV